MPNVPTTGGPGEPGAAHERLAPVVALLFVAYAAALALIAFWPAPVDRGAKGLLDAIERWIPLLSYELIEFSANVVMFVPLGFLLAVLLRRRRWLVLPLAIAVTLLIEVGQALLLPERTPSLRDVVANTAGAAIGLAVVLLITRRAAPEKRT